MPLAIATAEFGVMLGVALPPAPRVEALALARAGATRGDALAGDLVGAQQRALTAPTRARDQDHHQRTPPIGTRSPLTAIAWPLRPEATVTSPWPVAKTAVAAIAPASTS